jgi:hypothetical protein
MSDKGFDWFGEKDRDAIILGYQPPTAVYSTTRGDICIRQKADATEEYDPELFLTPQGALAVAWTLIEEAHNVGLPEPSLSLMAESPHWPPVTKPHGVPSTPAPGLATPGTEAPEPCPLLKVMQEAAE